MADLSGDERDGKLVRAEQSRAEQSGAGQKVLLIEIAQLGEGRTVLGRLGQKEKRYPEEHRLKIQAYAWTEFLEKVYGHHDAMHAMQQGLTVTVSRPCCLLLLLSAFSWLEWHAWRCCGLGCSVFRERRRSGCQRSS